jgi:hypothetical protein
MKADAVMKRVSRLVCDEIDRGGISEADGLQLLSDVGDICQVYVFARDRMSRQRVARIAWERDGIDRRMVVAGEAS